MSPQLFSLLYRQKNYLERALSHIFWPTILSRIDEKPEQRSPAGPELAQFREGQSREVSFHHSPCLANTSPDPSNPLIWQEHFSKPLQSFLVSRTSCQPKYSLRMVFVFQTRLWWGCTVSSSWTEIKETRLGSGAQIPKEVAHGPGFPLPKGCCEVETGLSSGGKLQVVRKHPICSQR